MYYGESTILNNLDLIYNNILNEQIFLDEFSIGEIGKAIKDKLKVIWEKFLTIIKTIKTKIVEFFQKNFSKNKENKDSNVDSYKTEIISEEEYNKVFNKSKEAQEERDANKDEPIDVGYEEIKDEMTLLFEQNIAKNRILKNNIKLSDTIFEDYNNYYNIKLCMSAFTDILNIITINFNLMKNFSYNTMNKTQIETNKYIKNIKSSINNFNNKKFSMSIDNLIKLKENNGYSYINNIINEHYTKFDFYDPDNNSTQTINFENTIFNNTIDKNINGIINYLKQKNDSLKDLYNQEDNRESIQNYLKTISEVQKLYISLSAKFMNFLNKEIKQDKSFQSMYLKITIAK